MTDRWLESLGTQDISQQKLADAWENLNADGDIEGIDSKPQAEAWGYALSPHPRREHRTWPFRGRVNCDSLVERAQRVAPRFSVGWRIWDMTLVGSVNRAIWNDSSLFCISPGQIWLSETGKKQAIQLFETRLSETFKHPHTGTSVEYSRIVELECRLLEKEWSSYPGEFGQMRLR